jgi:hypothetical protein
MSDPNILDKLPKSFSEFKVRITTYNGNVIDVTDQIMEIDLYETIYRPFIYGEFVIADNEALISSFPFIGQEKVRIEWKRDEVKIEKDFYVTEIYDVSRASENTTVYGLSITSEKQILNAVNLFSRAYTGRGDEIIKNIYDDYLNDDLEVLAHAKTSHNVVFPYMKPMQAIDMVIQNVLAEDDSPMYVFETMYQERPRLNSFRAMLEEDPILELDPSTPAKKSSNPDVSSSADSLSNRAEIYADKINRAYDLLENLTNGSYSSFSTVIDPSQKIGTRTDFDFIRYAPPVSNNHVSDLFTIDGRRLNRLYQTRNILIPQNANAFDNTLPNLNGVEELDKSILNAYENRSTLSSIKIHMDSVQIANNDEIFSVGRAVTYNRPKTTVKTADDKNRDITDKVNSGKYLVSSIHHRFDREEYTMAIELIRDGIGEDAELKESGEPPNFDTEPVVRQSILPPVN